MPLVSIVIPCFNAGKLLQETLDSVLPLLGKEVEVVVVNDGSTDPITLAILQRHANSFCVLNTENKGLSAARNAGIRQAKGKYIYPLDADDRANLAFINEACELLQKNDACDIVFANRIHFGEESLLWEAKLDQTKQWYVNRIPATALYRKELWERVGGYDESMVKGYEDWEFWLHALVIGAKFFKAKNPAYWYRVRSQSMVRTISVHHHQKLLAYMHAKHHGFFLKQYISQVNQLHELRSNYRLLLKALIKLILRKVYIK